MLTHILEGCNHQRALEGGIPWLEAASPPGLNGNGGLEEHRHVLMERSHRIMWVEDRTCSVGGETLPLCVNVQLLLCDALEENTSHQE